MRRKISLDVIVCLVLSAVVFYKISTAHGQSSSSPFPIGVTASTTVENMDIFDPSPPFDLKVTLLEIARGGKAWDLIKEASGSNKAPKAGLEYILARIRFEYYPRAGTPRDRTYELRQDEFTAASANGTWYGTPSIVLPKPMLKPKLRSGESSEGWVAFLVPQNDSEPRMFFGRGNIWFQLY